MYHTEKPYEIKISAILDALNTENVDIINSINSKDTINKTVKSHFFKYLKRFDLINIFKRIRVRYNIKRLPKDISVNAHEVGTKYNYFSDERIAVYYALFGSYDKVMNPVFKPDNCDFYIVTDQKATDKFTTWKKISVDGLFPELNSFSNSEKNRFFKMHPQLIFPDYKYSIYLDSNILPVGDLTAFINMIDKYGMAFHSHRSRNCVYSEAKAAEMLGKLKHDEMKEYISFLNDINMEKNYGLPECNIIAREHNNPDCIQIMEEWWKCFKESNIKRDQLWLPIVLKNNGIKVEDVTRLGTNVYLQPLVRVLFHN